MGDKESLKLVSDVCFVLGSSVSTFEFIIFKVCEISLNIVPSLSEISSSIIIFASDDCLDLLI